MARLTPEELAGIQQRLDQVKAAQAELTTAEIAQADCQEAVDDADEALTEAKATTDVASLELETAEADFMAFVDESFQSA